MQSHLMKSEKPIDMIKKMWDKRFLLRPDDKRIGVPKQMLIILYEYFSNQMKFASMNGL